MAGALEMLVLDYLKQPRGDRWFLRPVVVDYVRKRTEDEIIRQINLITDRRVFGQLLSVGLSQRLQDALVTRGKELES